MDGQDSLIAILIFAVFILFLAYTETKSKNETEKLKSSFNSERIYYMKKYKNYSKSKLRAMKEALRIRYIDYWESTVDEYNRQNPSNKIVFYEVDLYGNTQNIDDDTQADYLIARVNLEFIAEFRAINDLLTEQEED